MSDDRINFLRLEVRGLLETVKSLADFEKRMDIEIVKLDSRVSRLERIIDKIQGRWKISKQTDIDDEFTKGEPEGK
jgi:hypothetical protein